MFTAVVRSKYCQFECCKVLLESDFVVAGFQRIKIF